MHANVHNNDAFHRPSVTLYSILEIAAVQGVALKQFTLQKNHGKICSYTWAMRSPGHSKSIATAI
jgi:hypothetical protein